MSTETQQEKKILKETESVKDLIENTNVEDAYEAIEKEFDGPEKKFLKTFLSKKEIEEVDWNSKNYLLATTTEVMYHIHEATVSIEEKLNKIAPGVILDRSDPSYYEIKQELTKTKLNIQFIKDRISDTNKYGTSEEKMTLDTDTYKKVEKKFTEQIDRVEKLIVVVNKKVKPEDQFIKEDIIDKDYVSYTFKDRMSKYSFSAENMNDNWISLYDIEKGIMGLEKSALIEDGIYRITELSTKMKVNELYNKRNQIEKNTNTEEKKIFDSYDQRLQNILNKF